MRFELDGLTCFLLRLKLLTTELECELADLRRGADEMAAMAFIGKYLPLRALRQTICLINNVVRSAPSAKYGAGALNFVN